MSLCRWQHWFSRHISYVLFCCPLTCSSTFITVHLWSNFKDKNILPCFLLLFLLTFPVFWNFKDNFYSACGNATCLYHAILIIKILCSGFTSVKITKNTVIVLFASIANQSEDKHYLIEKLHTLGIRVFINLKVRKILNYFMWCIFVSHGNNISKCIFHLALKMYSKLVKEG